MNQALTQPVSGPQDSCFLVLDLFICYLFDWFFCDGGGGGGFVIGCHVSQVGLELAL